MGFPEDLAKKALIKVNYESVPAAVEAAVTLQAEAIPPTTASPAQKRKTLVQWSCERCTVVNTPGGATCNLCFGPAPESAFVDEAEEKAKEAEEKRRKEEEEARAEAERRRQEELSRQAEEKKLAEERHKQIVDTEFELTKAYYGRAQVAGFLFGSVNEGRDRMPLVVGAVLNDSEQEVTDVHLKGLEYRRSYLSAFFGRDSAPVRAFVNRLTGEGFADKNSCIQSLLINNQLLLESLFPALGGETESQASENPFLKSRDLAVVRLPLKSVTAVCQLGTDVAPGKPLSVLVLGPRPDGRQSAFLVALNPGATAGDRTSLPVSVKELPDDCFEGTEIGQVKQVVCVSASRAVAVRTEARVSLFQLDESQKFKHLSTLTDCDSACELVKAEGDTVFVSKEGSLRCYSVSGLSGLAETEATRPSPDVKAIQSEGKQAGSSIDPDKLTVEDIKKYEALMEGKAVAAVSNATAPRGLVSMGPGSKPTYLRHTWLADGEKDFGPLEMQFGQRVNLISLNIDLTFSCRSAPSQAVATSNAAAEPQLEGSSLVTDDLLVSGTNPKPSEDPLKSLGPFSIKGGEATTASTGDESKARTAEPAAKEEGVQYLPLIVQQHKGAQFNSSHQVNTIALDDNQVFASNYARPEFYFKHLHGETMSIDQFTVRSQAASRCGAYPVGRGLIFMADSLESFEWTTPFHKFTADDYSKWKQARLKDPRPLRPFEPVAFFEFDERPSVTVDIDFKKSCRFIMLKPTGFRTKPHHFRQSVNDLPMELEFFGAVGASRPRDPDSEYCGQGDTRVAAGAGVPLLRSGHSLVIHDLTSGEELLTLENAEITSLSLTGLPLDSALDAQATPFGQAAIRVSDLRVSLRTLDRLSVRITRGDSEQTWRLQSASIVGVVTQAGQLPALDRSLLISPEHFDAVNKHLAKMVMDPKYTKELRASIMEFLTKLVSHDYHFAQLLLDTIDLRKFIEVNLLSNDQAHIQDSVEFLRCFQSEPAFVKDIFEISISFVESVLPHSVPPVRGYEALIGMLSWAMPLDIFCALEVLMRTLYTTICKGCLPQVQTKEYIKIRTRLCALSAETQPDGTKAGDHFPLDQVLLKPLSHKSRAVASF